MNHRILLQKLQKKQFDFFFYQSKLIIIIPALVRSFIISLIRQLYMDDWDLLNDTFLEVWLLIDTFLQGWRLIFKRFFW